MNASAPPRPAPAGRSGRLALATVLATVLGLLAVLLPAAPSTAGAVDPLTGSPEKGECYDVTYAQSAGESIDEEPVLCTERHTIWVTNVILIPGTDPIDPASPALQAQLLTACYDARDTAIGGDLTRFGRSVYQIVYFVPTQAQRDAGARWASCGLVLLKAGGLVSTTRPTPARLASDRVPASLALCVNRKFQATPCSESHIAKSKVGIALKGADATVERAQKIAERTCPRKVGRAYAGWYFRSTDVKRGLLNCMVRDR